MGTYLGNLRLGVHNSLYINVISEFFDSGTVLEIEGAKAFKLLF